jgi:deoxyribodipyrimidine photo-lyase
MPKNMEKKHRLSLFIFRRDLRITDNTGLLDALEQSELVIPCFIFDPRQVSTANRFLSTNAVQFMIESLQDLESQLATRKAKLYLFYDYPELIIEKLIKTLKVDAVFVNEDYTPFSVKRDETLKDICARYTCVFNTARDLLLTAPDEITTGQGAYYSKFTPFFKKASHKKIALPNKAIYSNFYTKPISEAQKKTIYTNLITEKNYAIAQQGGRKHALTIVKKLSQYKAYQKERDYPSLHTTMLSAHNKFGTISIREVYHAIGKHLGYRHLLIQQLFWRDFFTHVAYHSPFVFGQSFQKKYISLNWKNNSADFKAWCSGTTGFPIVDAGMRQLNTTGFMHNRTRMIVASFLVKDLHIDWQWGEQYFATKLVDYDPAVNNGNWQWCASTGCDAQPYFRIFNPWLQQKKFDPDCIYIKQWIPQLKNIDAKTIHNWHKKNSPEIADYPRPRIDHTQETALTKKIYRMV